MRTRGGRKPWWAQRTRYPSWSCADPRGCWWVAAKQLILSTRRTKFTLIIPDVLNNLALHIIVPINSETSPNVRRGLWRETAFKRLSLTSLSAAPLFGISDDLSLKYSCCAQEGREGGCGVTAVLTACDSNELHNVSHISHRCWQALSLVVHHS